MYKYSTIFFLLIQFSYGQTNYNFKKNITAEDKKMFLGYTKEIFVINDQIEYSFSGNDYQPTYKTMFTPLRTDDAYLEELTVKLKKDSLNPITLNEIGGYYNRKADKVQAKKHFQMSLENISMSYFKKDSANFYSFRGLLKSNLEYKDYLSDIEKALKINPNDSLSICFYPMLLIKEKKFEKARQICINSLEKKDELAEMSYLYLILSYVYEKIPFIMNIDNQKKSEYENLNFDEIIDYQELDKYALHYKENIKIQHLRKFSSVLGLVLKMAFLKTREKDEFEKINYNKYENKKLKELEKWFINAIENKTINHYSAYKNLGMISLCLNNNDTAIMYLKKSLDSFPKSKEDENFNPSEVYNLLATIYDLKGDMINLKKTIEDHIENELDGQKSIENYLNMARLYLYEEKYEEAEKWCRKAKEIDPSAFNVYSMIAHCYYMQENNLLSEFYLQESFNKIQNTNEQSNLFLQLAIYQILNKNIDEAYNNLETSKKTESSNECKICDELIDNYFEKKQN